MAKNASGDLESDSPATWRPLLRVLAQVGASLGVTVRPIGGGWMAELVKGSERRLLHGYQLELNAASAAAIATDKAAAFDVLGALGLAAVPHRVFLHPRLSGYAPEGGNWGDMLKHFEGLGRDVVLKDNSGTGGMGVYRVQSERALEACTYRLFQRAHGLAIAPFVVIDREVRVIVLDGAPMVAIEKHRPSVTGDGVSSLRTLIERGVTASMAERIGYTDPDLLAELEDVIPTGARRLLNWRHNVGQGTTPRLLNLTDAGVAVVLKGACEAAAGLRVRFASVDMVEVGGQWMVLEVNAGVMMDGLMRLVPEGEALAETVYAAALERMFRSETQ